MTKPSQRHCLIIGAMKCGTTALFKYLQRSGSARIAASSKKDTKFFIHPGQNGNWGKGVDWYAAQFHPLQGHPWLLEASTHYTKYPNFPGVAQRIRGTLHNVKLIYLVRNPLQRSLSHFFHNRFVDQESRNINDIIEKQPNKYLNYSNYALQLKQYYEHFEADDLLVINVVEDAYRTQSLDRLQRFLQWNQPLSPDHFLPANTLQGHYEKSRSRRPDRPINATDLARQAGMKAAHMDRLTEICAEYGRDLRKLLPVLDYDWMTKAG